MIPTKAAAGGDVIVPVLEAPKYRRKMRAPISQQVDLLFVRREDPGKAGRQPAAGSPTIARAATEPARVAPRTPGPGRILDTIA